MEEIEHTSEITEKFEKKLSELTVQETLAVLLHAGVSLSARGPPVPTQSGQRGACGCACQ